MTADQSLQTSVSHLTAGWTLFAVYWGFLAALAIVELRRPAFPPLKADTGRLRTNFVLALVSLLATASLPATIIAAALWAQQSGTGLLNMVVIGPVWEIVAALLARSFLMYWFHRAFHELPWLWRLHAIHHSDTSIDLTTSFRAHPVSTLLILGVQLVFVVALGLSPVGLMIYELAYALSSPWHHANVATSSAFERRMARFIVTPGFHHIHHSAAEPQTNSNYGELFTLWDRLFGTATAPQSVRKAALRIGLGDAYDAGSESLRTQLALPFRPIPPPPTPQLAPVRPSADRE